MGYNTTSSVGCQNQTVKAQEPVKQPVNRVLRAGVGKQVVLARQSIIMGQGKPLGDSYRTSDSSSDDRLNLQSKLCAKGI